MKRDMELVRNILLAIESENGSFDSTRLNRALGKLYKDSGTQMPSYEIIVEHLEIMAEEDTSLVSVNIVKHMGGPPAFLGLRMMWAGHDFLANARTPSVWEKALPKMEGLSFDLIKQLLFELAKQTVLPISGNPS